jgi:hypothetical protein
MGGAVLHSPNMPSWHGAQLGGTQGQLYINDLPPTINTLLGPILFADDTSVIISSINFDSSSVVSNTVLSYDLTSWS